MFSEIPHLKQVRICLEKNQGKNISNYKYVRTVAQKKNYIS